MRFVAYLVLISTLVVEILVKTAASVVAAVSPTYRSRPSIIEFPLRCTTPHEVSMMSMSIAVTPGSLVLATADADPETGEPGRMYVHLLNTRDRETELAELTLLESRILAATRGPRWEAES